MSNNIIPLACLRGIFPLSLKSLTRHVKIDRTKSLPRAVIAVIIVDTAASSRTPFFGLFPQSLDVISIPSRNPLTTWLLSRYLIKVKYHLNCSQYTNTKSPFTAQFRNFGQLFVIYSSSIGEMNKTRKRTLSEPVTLNDGSQTLTSLSRDAL